jgi:hypothetical protein
MDKKTLFERCGGHFLKRLIVWLKVRVLSESHVQRDHATDEVGRLLASVHFESRGKVEELVT